MAVGELLHAAAELPEHMSSEGISDSQAGWQLIGAGAIASFMFYSNRVVEGLVVAREFIYAVDRPYEHHERID